MRKNILLITAILSMFVFSLQITEPAAAASLKLVDHGSIKSTDPVDSKYTDTHKWTTYQKGVNYVVFIEYDYYPQCGEKLYTYLYLQKVSKTKIKMTGKSIYKYYGSNACSYSNLGTHYDYTKLTAARYYWRVFKPEIMSQLT